jgi:DNA-binding MarR family transcriptional regulator
MTRLTQRDFERLLEFRVALRRFQRWSEDQAQAAGLTHVQHQLLVAIKGHPGHKPPTIGDLAGDLLLQSHSTVELVDRAEAAGLVERTPDPDDGRVVRVRLTRTGERVLQKLTRAHLDRLHELAKVLDDVVTRHDGSAGSHPQGGGLSTAARSGDTKVAPFARQSRARSKTVPGQARHAGVEAAGSQH